MRSTAERVCVGMDGSSWIPSRPFLSCGTYVTEGEMVISRGWRQTYSHTPEAAGLTVAP